MSEAPRQRGFAHRLDRSVHRGALAVMVLGLVATSCADTDPTSQPDDRLEATSITLPGTPTTIPPSTDAPAATEQTTIPPSTVAPTTTEQTTATSATTGQTTIVPTTIGPVAPGQTTPDPATTTDEPTGTSLAAAFTTDEPTFDVEPLQPFVVAAAASQPRFDDTGVELPTGWAAFDVYLEDVLLTNGNTAASVAVAIGGEIVHTSAFGIRAPFISADRASPTDRFRIASISKPITAITLLQLVEDGVVGLDEPVGQIVADALGVTPSSGAAAVTIRRLLNHTSGFGKYDTQFFRGGSADCRDAARTGMTRGAGGGGYRYSNMNFCVAGILIEALTSKSYVAAAYQHLLTPLGLSGMRLAATYDPGPDEILHPSTPARNYMETLGGAGSWIATPSDLVTIMNSLDLTTPGFKPLRPPMLDLMKTPVGGQLGQRGYGLGLISYGPDRYGHTGTIENTHAMTMNRGDGVTWSITVSGPYPDDTPRLETFVNRAFEAAGFIAG